MLKMETGYELELQMTMTMGRGGEEINSLVLIFNILFLSHYFVYPL